MPRRSPAFVLVHVVWATLEREPLIPVDLDDQIASLMGAKARESGCEVFAVGCAPDHVHVLLRLAAVVCLADAVQRLKGGTAYAVNRRAMVSHRLAWQSGYWAESLGPADTAPLMRYLRSQRLHHDDSHPSERWQLDLEPAEGGL